MRSLCVLLLVLATSAERISPSDASPLLRVVATEYGLLATTIPHAGTVTVRLVNHGREPHYLVIAVVAQHRRRRARPQRSGRAITRSP